MIFPVAEWEYHRELLPHVYSLGKPSSGLKPKTTVHHRSLKIQGDHLMEDYRNHPVAKNGNSQQPFDERQKEYQSTQDH